MSNEIQKLKPVERSLYRRVYMSAIEDRQTPDAAHRDGLKAVKQWNEIGAFNEENEARAVETTDRDRQLARGFEAVVECWRDDEARVELSMDEHSYEFLDGKISLVEFRRRLGLDRDSSG